MLEIREEENLMVMLDGDLNGNVGEEIDGFDGVHEGKGYGNRNVEEEMLAGIWTGT